MNLREMMADDLAGAQKLIEGGGECLPMFTALTGDDATICIATPYGDETEKRLALAFVRLLFIRHQVKAYVHLSETWSIERDPGEERGTPPPEFCADRIEKIVAVGADVGGAKLLASSIISRAGGIQCAAPVWVEHSPASRLEGRLFDLLPPPSPEPLSAEQLAALDALFRKFGGTKGGAS